MRCDDCLQDKPLLDFPKHSFDGTVRCNKCIIKRYGSLKRKEGVKYGNNVFISG